LPAGDANAGPPDFLFVAAADYLLLRIATRHDVGTSAVNGPSFWASGTPEVPDDHVLLERAAMHGGLTTKSRVEGFDKHLTHSTGGRRHGRNLSLPTTTGETLHFAALELLFI
jgi:hypothetical protein